MNDPQSQQCNAPPMSRDQKMSLADLAAVAAIAEPIPSQRQVSSCVVSLPQETTQCMQPPQARPPCTEHEGYPSCRHVQFHEARIVGTVMPCSHMSQQEKEEIWYSNSSLDKFKNQVRSMCRKLRECPQKEAKAMATTPDIPADAMSAASDESNPRGLEHRVCRKRLRNKQIALRCVLKAQMRSSCPDFIANISSKCTFWAKEIARDEGSRDFAAAYSEPEDLNASVASMDISTGESTITGSTLNSRKEKKPCPMQRLLCKNKRRSSFDSDCSDSRPRKNCRFSGNGCNGGLKSIFKCKKDCDP